jgi:ankyrin repeat protein
MDASFLPAIHPLHKIRALLRTRRAYRLVTNQLSRWLGPVATVDVTGVNPSVIYARTPLDDTVQVIILQRFACPECAKFQDGWTPLHHASAFGHLDVVRNLIEERGADVNAKDKVSEFVGLID